MSKVFSFVCLAAVCTGSVLEREPSLRIVGGSAIPIDYIPYQVAFSAGTRRCGGSIISGQWVVTAAQCTHGLDIASMFFRAGSTNYEEGGTRHDVVWCVEHPEFDSSTHDYDIALMKVDPPFVWRSGVDAIPLVDQGEKFPDGTLTVVSGWGSISQEGDSELPTDLHFVGIPLISRDACRAAYSSVSVSITDRMLCAGTPKGGIDACQGDAGGPMMIKGKLAGVVSLGAGCGDARYPGVYANVADLHDWIMDNAGGPNLVPSNTGVVAVLLLLWRRATVM